MRTTDATTCIPDDDTPAAHANSRPIDNDEDRANPPAQDGGARQEQRWQCMVACTTASGASMGNVVLLHNASGEVNDAMALSDRSEA
ncbi:hypothetical protein Scep_023745 [Stephania cephalantha]|uniref:Uncharacterized protein n=1 Tax=Stephania cephalantha TaxID=152367 RepID=A0AAP0EV86_9MAGN